jgi:hypothetical protein
LPNTCNKKCKYAIKNIQLTNCYHRKISLEQLVLKIKYEGDENKDKRSYSIKYMYIKQDIGTGQVFKHSAKTAGILQAE